MAHPFTTNLRTGDFNTTAVTNPALVANPLVLTTSTLVVLSWAKDSLIKQTLLFWLQCPVVDGFRLLYFTV